MRTATNRRAVRRGTRSSKRPLRNTKKPNYRLLTITFFISMVVSTGISFALRTPTLNVRDVKISGVRFCDEDAVKSPTKCLLGGNILLARKSPVIQRLCSLSQVDSVRMGRTFPDKMWIEVQERKPFAAVVDGENYCLVQSDGMVFHKISNPVKGVPLVVIPNDKGLRVGKISNSAWLMDAIEVLKCAREKKLTVGKISIDHAGNMCLNMDSDFCVRLGQPDEIDKKISVLHRTMEYRPSMAREAEYLDISCPGAPSWKPKLTAQASSS